ncbi:MAG: anion permease [Candidatus Nanosalina sp.]
MGLSIGASTVASAFGPVNSSGSANVLRSALLAGFFALLGAVAQGENVTQTVGSGLVSGEIATVQAAIILLVAASLVIASVLMDYPMPTAFTVIGSVIGSALGFSQAVSWFQVQRIVGYWLLVPFLAIGLGFGIAKVLRYYLPENGAEKEIRYLLLFTGSYVAYSAGASALGLAVGPLTSSGFSVISLLVLGGVSILLGAWTYSPRIIRAVSFDYSSIGPRRSVAALGTAAILAQIGIFLGIPISFNEAVIASVIGSGLVEGRENIGGEKIKFTVAAWTGAFLLATALSYGFSAVAASLI